MKIVNTRNTISPKARKLVDILVAKGCTITEASKLAGYKGVSSRVRDSMMLQKPEVQEYMLQHLLKDISLQSSHALSSISRLSREAKSDYVRLEASKDILDRAGYKAPDRHQHLIAGSFDINIDLS